MPTTTHLNLGEIKTLIIFLPKILKPWLKIQAKRKNDDKITISLNSNSPLGFDKKNCMCDCKTIIFS